MSDTRIKNDHNIQIGTNIRRIREQHKMRNSELVCAVNLLGIALTPQSLSKIEANTQHITASQFKAIIQVLGCDPLELLQSNDISC